MMITTLTNETTQISQRPHVPSTWLWGMHPSNQPGLPLLPHQLQPGQPILRWSVCFRVVYFIVVLFNLFLAVRLVLMI